MNTVDKSMESVSKAGSGYTISLIDSASGAVLYQESLRVHDVDYATHKFWSARLPVPSNRASLRITDSKGLLVFFPELKLSSHRKPD